MAQPRSDALVVFGVTGDLAYKQIFPALHAMVRRDHLDVPVLGVARSGWTSSSCGPGPGRAWSTGERWIRGVFASLRVAPLRRAETTRTPGRTSGCVGRWAVRSGPFIYLAIPPSLFATVAAGPGQVG